MQSFDLHRELQVLADELGPFESDLADVHRRNRRHKLVRRGIALAVAALVAICIVAVVARDRGKRVTVEGRTKQATLHDLDRIGIVVVPRSSDVQRTLDRSPLVAGYAPVYGLRSVADGKPSLAAPLGQVACALAPAGGFVVQTENRRGVEVLGQLQQSLPAGGHAYSLVDKDADLEIFMKPDAPPAEVDAVRASLDADRSEVTSYRFLSHDDAYNEFKRIFADQPSLVAGTDRNALPESFRVILGDQVSVQAVAGRFQNEPGVDSVVTVQAGTAISSLFAGMPRQAAPVDQAACRAP